MVLLFFEKTQNKTIVINFSLLKENSLIFLYRFGKRLGTAVVRFFSWLVDGYIYTSGKKNILAQSNEICKGVESERERKKEART